MAVQTTNNKPINPRGNDQSPKGYNRAALYSGKALDFDGVNDYVDLDGFTMAGNVATIVFQAKFISDGYLMDINTQRFVIRNRAADGVGVYNSNGWVTYGFTNRDELGFYAVVSDGTTQRVYYNGHQLGFDKTVTALDWDSITNMALGSSNDGTFSFLDGQIAGFKIFNTALTAAQVADLYNNPEKVVPTGVDNTALKLWLPMMEGAGTTCINGAPDALGSELITNGDFSDGTNDWTFGSAFSVVNGKAYYNDSASGNQIYQSNLTFSTSKNYVLTFDISDATDAVIWVGNSAGSNAYTINTNYHTYNNGHYSLFLRGSDIGASETSLAFWANPSGAAFSIDNISLKEVANCGTISGATWTHGIGSPVAQTSVIDWNKWKLEGGSSTNEYLIPQGLTAGRDLLGNLFENVRKQGALNLDGNSWAEVHDNASLDMTTTATMEAWVNCDNLVAAYQIIMVKSSDTYWTGNYGRYTLRANQNSVNWWFDDYTANSKTHSISLSGYNHLVVTKDGTTEKLYINGALVSTKTGAATFTASPYSLVIGAQSSYAENWDNQLAQPRIYNRALTAEEVLRNYNSGKSTYQ